MNLTMFDLNKNFDCCDQLFTNLIDWYAPRIGIFIIGGCLVGFIVEYLWKLFFGCWVYNLIFDFLNLKFIFIIHQFSIGFHLYLEIVPFYVSCIFITEQLLKFHCFLAESFHSLSFFDLVNNSPLINYIKCFFSALFPHNNFVS